MDRVHAAKPFLVLGIVTKSVSKGMNERTDRRTQRRFSTSGVGDRKRVKIEERLAQLTAGRIMKTVRKPTARAYRVYGVELVSGRRE